MKLFLPILMLFPLILQSSASFAASCPDQDSQQAAGYTLAMANAQGALPGVEDLQSKISSEKFHQLSKTQKWWDPDEADYLSFDVLIGTPSAGAVGGYSPAVAYTVTVDTNCKVTVLQDYSIE